MKHSKYATILLAGAVTMLVLVAAIGWWASSPENLVKGSMGMAMLALCIGSIQQIRRFPKASPVVLCASIVGLGFPYLVATAGPTFTKVFTALVVAAWTYIGLVRIRAQSSTSVHSPR